MRILQVVPYFPPAYAFGGPVKVVYQISKELAMRGHEVVVYTTDAKDLNARLETCSAKAVDELKDYGIRVCFFRNFSMITVRKFKLFITPEIISHMGKEIKQFDVIHLHEYRTFQNIVIRHYARKSDVPYLLQAHGSIPRISAWRRLKWFYDVFFGYRLLRDAAKVIALTSVETEQYKAMGVPGEKITIIPNGIDLSEYAELPPKGTFRKKFNIPEGKRIILYLGRINKIKGIDTLIEAYAYLRNKMNFKDAVLVIAGPDDGYTGQARALANSLRTSDEILFVGPLYDRDKLAAYVDSHLCVLPSRYETFPMALLEMCACGKPVVASNLEGLKELIVDGETGLLFEAGDFKQMAEKMVYLLNDDSKAAEIGIKARWLVEETYSIDRVVDNLEELYVEIASRKFS
jgi:glycosyltransferase involved in cell wall biosynthesis